MSTRARHGWIILLVSAVAVIVGAFLILRARGGPALPPLAPSATARREAPSPWQSAAVDPCARHKPANQKLGWVCHDDGRPVDLVTEKSMLMSVLHEPTPVLVLETQRLDPSVAVMDPKRPPRAVCALNGSAAGLSGYVAWEALHDAPCPRK